MCKHGASTHHITSSVTLHVMSCHIPCSVKLLGVRMGWGGGVGWSGVVSVQQAFVFPVRCDLYWLSLLTWYDNMFASCGLFFSVFFCVRYWYEVISLVIFFIIYMCYVMLCYVHVIFMSCHVISWDVPACGSHVLSRCVFDASFLCVCFFHLCPCCVFVVSLLCFCVFVCVFACLCVCVFVSLLCCCVLFYLFV